MDNVERVIIACPKCKQKLRCEAGGAGTCPKCGTHVTFPDSIYQADPELNRFELERIYREKNKPTEDEDEEEEKGGRKGGKIIKRILLVIVLLLVIGGLVFGGLKVKDMLTKSDDKKEANAYTVGTWVTDLDTVAAR
ncbi:MAG: hypothetical protein Q3Y08_08730 [Butyricicoccus sp.]|nr:hypothetical protein [Butyricicoccus sp.]